MLNISDLSHFIQKESVSYRTKERFAMDLYEIVRILTDQKGEYGA